MPYGQPEDHTPGRLDRELRRQALLPKIQHDFIDRSDQVLAFDEQGGKEEGGSPPPSGGG